jgi:asparagine synthase (glutamine-hydrolysing)
LSLTRPPGACERLRNTMIASMQSEKFHVSGDYAAPELGLFAGWVALEGSSLEDQPLVRDHNGIAVVLAGECFPEGVTGIDAKHYQAFIDLYERHGAGAVERLNGLFSALLVDRRQGRVWLFNDRYGMEKLYYHETPTEFFFASEAKALLKILPETRAFDDQGLLEFLHYGCTLEWKTLYRNIRLVPSGTVCTLRAGQRHTERRYFDVSTWENLPALPRHSFATQLTEALRVIVPRYLATDGPTGISLTGGLDTRMILSSWPQGHADVVAYTFAGNVGTTFDLRRAAEVAGAFNAPHHPIRIGTDFFRDFPTLAERTVYITDGYLGITGAHEIYLNHHARAFSPVRLTGNYGSEVLRGGTTFKPRGLWMELIHPDIQPRLAVTKDPVNKEGLNRVTFAAFKEIPWRLHALARAAQSQVSLRTPYMDNDLVALAFRTPATLRESAEASLHVVRTGDRRLSAIPTDTGLLATSRVYSALAHTWHRGVFKLDYWRKEALPGWLSVYDKPLSSLDRLLGSHRYLLYRSWFRSELAGYIKDQLMDRRVSQSGLWNREVLERLADYHIEGRRNCVRELDVVLTCAAIERLLLRTGSTDTTVA